MVSLGLKAERSVAFPGAAGVIEGRVANETSHKEGALVVLHPHPSYGGSMDNNVVETVVLAGQVSNLTTLRFNFRGVGGSQGRYDHGVGEQDDVGAALNFLEKRYCPKTKVLVGYSFGACVALAYCHREGHGVDHLFLISPPPFILPDDLSLELSVVRKIVLGEHDDIAPPQQVTSRVSGRGAVRLIEVLPGADHFYFGKEGDVKELLSGLFDTFMGAGE
ncbi:MAG: alpha/beta fold hydrolase [Thermodesulfobacteriota bacterium]|nr:alpha/beta fold hydrolase [Thermodesulfobacteriota bacterium]